MIGLWTLLGRPGPERFAAALCLSTVSAIAGVALLGLSGWFLAASALAGLAGAGAAFNHLIPSAAIRGLAFTRVLARYGDQVIGHAAILRLSAVLRPALFERAAFSSSGMRATPSGELSTLIDDVEAAEGGFLRVVSPAAAAAASALVAIGWTTLADPVTAWTAGIAFMVFGFLLPWSVSVRTRRLAAEAAQAQREAREVVSRLVENALELDILKALDREARSAFTRMDDAAMAASRLEAPHRRLGALTSTVGGSVAAILLMRISGSADTAIVAGAALSLIAAFEACGAMARVMDAAPRARDASARLQARLRQVNDPPDPPQGISLSTVLPISARTLVVSAIGDGHATSPLNLDCEAGSVIEISGPSGCGKTTLLETLARLRSPRSGALSYGGHRFETVRTAAVLEHVALAPQFPEFLPGSVREALCLACPDASDEDLDQAIETSCAGEFLRARSEGLESDVSLFSGGERRRLAIARALLARPQVLLLDEPFSGLEPDLIDRLGLSLSTWIGVSGRSIVYTRHEPITPDWRGVRLVHFQLV
jgi:ATP-binding cassette subfamily C protein CydC